MFSTAYSHIIPNLNNTTSPGLPKFDSRHRHRHSFISPQSLDWLWGPISLLSTALLLPAWSDVTVSVKGQGSNYVELRIPLSPQCVFLVWRFELKLSKSWRYTLRKAAGTTITVLNEIPRHYDAMGAFLASALGGVWLGSRCGCFTTGKQVVTRRTEDYVGSRAGLVAVEKEKNLLHLPIIKLRLLGCPGHSLLT
jgi:hypothetical protein